ncbi:MAG: M24 family metallopeptidase [Symbiobacteriia bacterium]
MSSVLPFPREEFDRRLGNLRAGLEQAGLDAALLLDPADLVYFTGLGLHGQLLVPRERDPIYLVQINWARAKAESWVADVRPSLGLKTVRETLSELGLAGAALGVELDVLPAAQTDRLKETLKPGRVGNISSLIWGLRSVKSAAELAVMEQAGRISAANFARFRELTRPGVTEVELFAAMQQNEMELGADQGAHIRAWNSLLPYGVVLSGPNTAMISGYWMTMTGPGPSAAQPYGTGRRRLEPHDLVILDRVVSYQGYVVDEARTFVLGEPDARQQEYRTALETVLDAAISAVRPGAPVLAVYKEALRAATEAGIADVFMTRAEYDFEYVGHGVGLEMDEGPLVTPRAEMTMVPGMTLALEPKVIVPGWGGLTMEETVAVTPAGHRVLTCSARQPFAIPVAR